MRRASNPIFITVSLAISFIASPFVFGEPHGKGRGSGQHQMPDDFRGVIHSLFADHDKVERSVEVTDDGYRARTTSKDPKVAEMIRKHVSQMEARLDGGLGVRHWDPAFVELREHYADLSIALEKIDGGIAVAVVGKTPEAIAVARNHAKIISGFVEKGAERMHETHPAVVAKSGAASEVAAAGGGCDKNCGKGKAPCCAARAGKTEPQTDAK